MKSKCTRSSIPSFLSCSTTEPKFDLRISGYVLSWQENGRYMERKRKIYMEIRHVLCTKRGLDVTISTKDLKEPRVICWSTKTRSNKFPWRIIKSEQVPAAVMIGFTNLHLSLVGLLGVEPEALSWSSTSGTTGSLLGRSLTNSSYEQRLDSNTRVIHLCDKRERAMWIINAHHCTTAICQSKAILHLWLDYMYDSSSWAREMSAE